MALGAYAAETGRGNLLNALAHPSVVNPAAALEQGWQAAGTLYNLRDAQAQQAWGQALQQATDPRTGVVDWPTAQRLAAAKPMAAMGMAKNLQNASNIRGQQIDQAARTGSMISNVIGAALQGDDTGLQGRVVQGLQYLHSQGIDPGALFGAALTLNGSDPKALRGQLEQARTAYMPSDQATTQIYGQPFTYTAPGGLQAGGTQNPRTGALSVPSQPGVQQGLPPTADPLVDWTGTDNVKHTTLQSIARQALQAGQVKGGATGIVPTSVQGTQAAPQSTAPPLPPPRTTLRGSTSGAYTPPGQTAQTQPPPPPNQQQSQPPPPNQPPPPQQGPVQSTGGIANLPGPTPTVTQAQAASADQYNADRQAASTFQSRMWPMVQSRAILEGDPGLVTGRGAETVSNIKGYLQTLGSIFTPADLQSIRSANFDQLGKYFQQAVNASPFAGRSDQALAGALTGNPNTHISTLANKQILSAMIGLERMKLAAFTDFQDTGRPPSDYADFATKWQTTHDPRAFITDMPEMNDARLKKMFATMSPAEAAAYKNSLDLIRKHPEVMNTAAIPH